jgi:hypothetical protein
VLKVFAKLASAFLLIWLFVSPAMACLLPNARLTTEEKECCRKMGGMCDEMTKNGSHSCCVKVTVHNHAYVIAKASASSLPHLQPSSFNFVVTERGVTVPAMLAFAHNRDGYPPGNSPPDIPELIAFRI